MILPSYPQVSRGDMSLAVMSRMVSGVMIVDMAGRLGLPDVTLRLRINDWLEEGHRAFVLNLANVSYVDSFGLSQLISVWTSVRNRGGRLLLLKPSAHVQTLLQITKLDTVFDVLTEEAHAVRNAGTSALEAGLHAISSSSSLP